MPHKISITTPLDEVQGEILYTQATLRADPEAADFLPLTDDWQGWLDAVRTQVFETLRRSTDVEAARTIANAHLDRVCVAFGDRLFFDCGKDRDSPRWRQFFKEPVSVFVRTALARQVTIVRAWLVIDDPLVREFRPELSKWVNACSDALAQTSAMSGTRGAAWIGRERLAEDLTHARDGLHDALSARARERKLPREWPDLFFRVQRRRDAERKATAAGLDTDTDTDVDIDAA